MIAWESIVPGVSIQQRLYICCITARVISMPGSGKIDKAIACYALEALHIDRYELDQIDNKILTLLIEKFHGGPVGLTTIATALSEDPGTLEEVYEPFLIQEGFLKRTPRGREVTALAYEHLGKAIAGRPGDLFQ